MRKADFDHVIASAAVICGEEEIVVIGSQSIWGSVEDPPKAMLRSLEADIYPRRDPSRAEEIDGQMGDGSHFQRTYGYYAHGSGRSKMTLDYFEKSLRVRGTSRNLNTVEKLISLSTP